jgi:hypothetical protein
MCFVAIKMGRRLAGGYYSTTDNSVTLRKAWWSFANGVDYIILVDLNLKVPSEFCMI